MNRPGPEAKKYPRLEGRLCKGVIEIQERQAHDFTIASRESDGPTKVLAVIANLQVSAKVLDSDLTAR